MCDIPRWRQLDCMTWQIYYLSRRLADRISPIFDLAA